jgi:ribonuclease HII
MICCAVSVNELKSTDLKDAIIPDLKDGKKLSKAQRLKIFQRLKETKVVNFKTVEVTPKQIDQMGMAKAWKFGIRQCIQELHLANPPIKKYVPRKVLIDGGFCKVGELNGNFKVQSVIKGDNKFYGISAAGIIAKETHTLNVVKNVAELNETEKIHFEKILLAGSGYWHTQEHADLLKKKIYTKFHRKSFNPLRYALCPEKHQLTTKRARFQDDDDEEIVPLPSKKNCLK